MLAENDSVQREQRRDLRRRINRMYEDDEGA
jgi:hypothetical protein